MSGEDRLTGRVKLRKGQGHRVFRQFTVIATLASCLERA